MSLRSLLAVVIVLAATSGRADERRLFRDPSFDVAVTRDVTYATGAVRAPSPGQKKLLLDVYEPKGEAGPALRPAVITFHGGGFKSGDKSGPASMADFCQELARRGFVCLSVDYRLEPDDPATPGASPQDRAVAAAVEDAANAMRWLRRNAAELRVDPSRMALAGRSAGATTVMQLAYSNTGRQLGVRAVVDMSGAMKGHEASIRKGDVPLCIIHGTNDTLVPVALAEALAERAAEVGVPHVVYLLEGNGNGHVRSFSREVGGVTLLERTVEFLDAYLVAPEQQTASTDSVVEFLLTSAATDFHSHPPATSLRFRDVRVGHVVNPDGQQQYMLCGQFAPAQVGDNTAWTPFVTIKTSGYEQYVGAQAASFCQHSTVLWDQQGDLSASLQSRLDSLR